MSRRPRATQDYNSLRKELIHANALFVDPQFPANVKSLYVDGRPPPGSRHEGPIVWKRPTDMFQNPEFMVEGAKQHDLDQGLLGNCWFIAGAAVLATSHPAELEKVVPSDQGFDTKAYTGMFRFNFWWYGKWTEVVIDDYLPTDGRLPIYCRNIERPNEFWPCLLEKAYAKLRGSYEALDGGKIQDALVDMTGGISEVIDLQKKNQVSPELYNLLCTSYQMRTLMGACIFKPENSPPNEIELPNGLYNGHAYSITGFTQIPTGRGTVNLLRLRNPWGRGEWRGAWSDRSPEMAKLSEDLKYRLMYEDKDDGEFWISYEDFIRNFDEIQLCHLQPDALIQELQDNNRKQDWNVTVYHDAWIKGVTAGGCGNSPYQNLYWKNPQFYVTLDRVDSTLGHGDDCTLIVSLMEKEKNNQSNIAVGFDIYKLKRPELRPLDNSRAPESALLLAKRSGSYVFYREVTKRFELSPGTYVIIPSTFQPHQEAEFLLRIFTEKRVDSGVLDETTITPTKPVSKDQLFDVFNKHAGNDQRMDASELSTFLEEVSTTDLRETLKFPVECCRSLVSLMDDDKSGFLDFNEAKRAWKEIKAYREVFKQFDKDNSNAVDTYELGDMFSKLGFPISRPVLTSIVRRYGGRENTISLTDFILVICRLTSLYASFHAQQKRKGVTEDNVDFSRNEFLEVTIFT
ncbi:calpain-9-like isoform X2 [Biomphalaria glabrata]|uniref:Calpain-9-like isoform X2 n=1 Tax=Biomphalaria glabrata TaxID=6526 RepID=A0A9W2ZLK7_BIOGL|nr:calpain-9-like isoform X2 [Biomphalaria glabrata]